MDARAGDWTEIIVKIGVADWERAEPIFHMLAPAGFYVEDYSALEDDVREIAHIDLIDDELLAKDRETALIHVYAAPGENPGELAALARERLSAAGIASSASMAAVREEDWANSWKKYFKPLRIGRRILIVPGWEDPPEGGGPSACGDGGASNGGASDGEVSGDRTSDGGMSNGGASDDGASGEDADGGCGPDGVAPNGSGTDGREAGRDVVIRIEPGMAFGTGGHASTKLCLELLERRAAPASRVLDVGAGSGILSIAAVLLGAESALGVDIDQYAVKVARRNAELNGAGDRAAFAEGDLAGSVSGAFDVVLANIVADTIIRLMPDLGRCLAPGGTFVCSGIVCGREGDVLAALGAHGLAAVETLREDAWVAIAAKRA
ncbi:MAG: 50S ribosomal protein L11 methyltransferase [Clostridiales bacterium]|nr:50S ribosomal protein L11 methyltransferase [Clostridiales bacterium]